MNNNIFNIKYQKKFPFIIISNENLFSIFLISLIVGIDGFISETILELIQTGYIVDRGFLIGPFIPIYFFCVFFGLAIFKTPSLSIKNFLKCTFFIGFMISFIEFITGNVCEMILKKQLWSYSHIILSYKYVSFVIGLIWGFLGSIFVFFLLPILKKIPDKINKKYHKINKKYHKAIVVIILMIISLDITLSFYLVFINNGYNELYNIKVF